MEKGELCSAGLFTGHQDCCTTTRSGFRRVGSRGVGQFQNSRWKLASTTCSSVAARCQTIKAATVALPKARAAVLVDELDPGAVGSDPVSTNHFLRGHGP
jgi:hypothetical protein